MNLTFWSHDQKLRENWMLPLFITIETNITFIFFGNAIDMTRCRCTRWQHGHAQDSRVSCGCWLRSGSHHCLPVLLTPILWPGQREGSNRVIFYTSHVGCYDTFIFLLKKKQTVCLQMLAAQNIPFVCGETDRMAQFQSKDEV